MDAANADVATMPIECFNSDITESQLRGESDGLAPGEIVLRERLKYFYSQQLQIESIPRCEKEVKMCSDYRPPTGSCSF